MAATGKLPASGAETRAVCNEQDFLGQGPILNLASPTMADAWSIFRSPASIAARVSKGAFRTYAGPAAATARVRQA